ncbi:hypothetical protein [Spirosoma spitsbergense]|uniref:hypothetical protein n=1 Tax=Spirosoma spitsbergense TaxID=431554 RepID=UPI00035F075A|nr:hypothetical protein [Spirosoma spitsbergense]
MSKSYSSETDKPERILADWAAAIADFHTYHQQVVTCISQIGIEHDLGRENIKSVFIGQCPVSLLVKLVATMQEELEKLLQDMDQLVNPGPSGMSQNYEKLAAHTHVLHQLNQEAQKGLHLVNLSNS